MTRHARTPAVDPATAAPPDIVTTTLLNDTELARAVDRIAHQIVEAVDKAGLDAVLLGIPTRGVPLARRLAERITAFSGKQLPIGSLDITLHRDDLRLRGVRPLGETSEPAGGVTGRTVILVDDVLFSGRTIRAALDALTELGRPRSVQVAVLVDRGHRQLPIRADYVGKNIPTSIEQQVRVSLTEIDAIDGVTITAAAEEA